MSRDHGSRAEQQVAHYLQTHNYRLVTQNYRSAWGEIDLIVTQGSTLAFVEVKMRTKPTFDMTEVITHSKQQKIIKTAQQFLSSNDWRSYYCRFDVVLVRSETGQITHIPNAFNAEGL